MRRHATIRTKGLVLVGPKHPTCAKSRWSPPTSAETGRRPAATGSLRAARHRQAWKFALNPPASWKVLHSVVVIMIGHNSLDGLALVCNVNGGLPAQLALSLLLQRSRRRRHSELAYAFLTWRMASSRSSISCATGQRRLQIDRARVAGGRAELLLLCCWPSGARGHLLWLLLLLELLVVLLAVLLLLLLVVVVQV